MKMNDYQKRIYYAEMLYEESALMNIGGVLSFDDEVILSMDQLMKIVKEIINKTVSLRLRLSRNLDFYEFIYEDYTPEAVRLDTDYEGVLSYAKEQMKIPFEDIYDSPLFLVQVIEYGGKPSIFFKLHHILGDSVSIQILAHSVQDGYYALKNGEEYVCKNISATYTQPDEEKRSAAEKYFSSKLRDYSPVRIARKEAEHTEAGEMCFTTNLYKKYMTEDFLTAIYIFLSEILDERRLAFGFVMGNRTREEMGVIGMFANTVPLMIDHDSDSLSELKKKIKSDIFKLIRFGFYVPKENMKINPYEVSVSYRYEDYLPDIDIGKTAEIFNGYLDVPLRISAEESGEALKFSIFYNKELYEDGFIKNMGESIIYILEQQQNGAEKISDIDFLTESEKKTWNLLNDTGYQTGTRDIIDIFRKNTRDETALIWDTGKLSGEELFELSQKMAHYLKPIEGLRVGIAVSRSPEMIVAVMGTLMAGKAFIILSDEVPGAEKFADIIIKKSDVDMALRTEGQHTSISTGTDAGARSGPGKAKEENGYGGYDPDSTAYLICTSGSTGEPKCIEISRHSLLVRLMWQNRLYGLNGRIMQKTVNTFDVSVWEMLSPVFGASLYLLPPGEERMPDRLLEGLIKYKIEKVHFVPTMLDAVLKVIDRKNICLPDLREVYVSGEKLEKHLVDDFFRILPGVRLMNFYGPAECTIDVTHFECVEGMNDIPIGRPVDNTSIYIMNSRGKILPEGVIGEICIGGDLVGKGYVTGEKPRSDESNASGYTVQGGERIFRTGDMGELKSDGNIYIYGRRDRQIKLRGMRVDLSGIKEIILSEETVSQAEVINVDNRLECYLVGDADVMELRKKIASRISAYAVPSVFRRVKEIPVNLNQKIDRDKLLSMEYEDMITSDKGSMSVPQTGNGEREKGAASGDNTREMRDILSEVSRVIKVGLDDNLFEYGLDSISVIDITTTLQDKGYDISFGDFYENLTIRAIAENLENKKYYTYLKKNENNDRVMICFPFAGGEPQNFSALAEKLDMDVIGIYISAFPENTSIRQIAKRLTGLLDLSKYENVTLYGHCVGSYIALEFASKLEKKVDEIILAAPSVRIEKDTTRPGITPWRLMNDAAIARVLKTAGGRYKYNKQVLRRFRVDTDRYFNYTHEESLRKRLKSKSGQSRVKVIFGDKDIFTTGKKKIIKKLEYITGGIVEVYDIKDGKHFMNDENVEELSEKILD